MTHGQLNDRFETLNSTLGGGERRVVAGYLPSFTAGRLPAAQ